MIQTIYHRCPKDGSRVCPRAAGQRSSKSLFFVSIYFHDLAQGSVIFCQKGLSRQIQFARLRRAYETTECYLADHLESLKHVLHQAQPQAGRPGGGGVELICSIFQFLWYKYSYCGQFQVTNELSLNEELGIKTHDCFLALYKPVPHLYLISGIF